MAIDTKIETLVTLSEAARLLPRINGKKIASSTLWRWCKKGLRGVNLEYLRVGSKVATTSEAMQRFFAALAALDATQPSIYNPTCLKTRGRIEKARQRSIDEANTILIEAGILKPTNKKDSNQETNLIRRTTI